MNVHGCGIGWYGLRPGCGLVDALGLSSYERPAVYTTTAAPSHDRNLRSLAKVVETGLLFGHVRAASALILRRLCSKDKAAPSGTPRGRDQPARAHQVSSSGKGKGGLARQEGIRKAALLWTHIFSVS